MDKNVTIPASKCSSPMEDKCLKLRLGKLSWTSPETLEKSASQTASVEEVIRTVCLFCFFCGEEEGESLVPSTAFIGLS